VSSVFISYSHKDSDYAHKLALTLEHQGISVWIDDRIDYGTQWPNVIQENLDNSTAVIVIMTPRSYQSQLVQNELTRAQDNGKPIFPLLLDSDKPFLAVQTIQYVDVRDGNLPPQRFFDRIRDVFQVPDNHALKEQNSVKSPVRLVSPIGDRTASELAIQRLRTEIFGLETQLRQIEAALKHAPTRVYAIYAWVFTAFSVFTSLCIMPVVIFELSDPKHYQAGIPICFGGISVLTVWFAFRYHFRLRATHKQIKMLKDTQSTIVGGLAQKRSELSQHQKVVAL